jgi:translation initiation factor IF-3
MTNVITDPNDSNFKLVLLIDHEGQKLGLKNVSEAFSIASDYGLDLVVVNESGDHPTCKIMDVKKQEYKKRISDRKSKSKTIKTKEVRINAGISENDLETKVRSIDNFLSKGHHVKMTIRSKERRDEAENNRHMKQYFDLVLSRLTKPHKIDEKPNISKNQFSMNITPQ